LFSNPVSLRNPKKAGMFLTNSRAFSGPIPGTFFMFVSLISGLSWDVRISGKASKLGPKKKKKKKKIKESQFPIIRRTLPKNDM
jgi:hypothetical protein